SHVCRSSRARSRELGGKESNLRCRIQSPVPYQLGDRPPADEAASAKPRMLGSAPVDVNHLGYLIALSRGRVPEGGMLPFERVAHTAARCAGVLLRARHTERQEIAFKSTDIDLVTATDRDAEALIVTALAEAFPEHGIVAE